MILHYTIIVLLLVFIINVITVRCMIQILQIVIIIIIYSSPYHEKTMLKVIDIKHV